MQFASPDLAQSLDRFCFVVKRGYLCETLQVCVGLFTLLIFGSLVLRLIFQSKKLKIKQDNGFVLICIIYAAYGASIILFTMAPLKWFLNVKALLQFLVCSSHTYDTFWLNLTNASVLVTLTLRNTGDIVFIFSYVSSFLKLK